MHERSARQSLGRRVTHPAQSGPQPAKYLRPFANRHAPSRVFPGVHSNETAAPLAYQTKGESAPRSGNRIQLHTGSFVPCCTVRSASRLESKIGPSFVSSHATRPAVVSPNKCRVASSSGGSCTSTKADQ